MVVWVVVSWVVWLTQLFTMGCMRASENPTGPASGAIAPGRALNAATNHHLRAQSFQSLCPSCTGQQSGYNPSF
jgi:hypothetical protein